MLKGQKMSDEQRSKTSAALKGRPAIQNIGLVRSDETREKIAAANRGKVASEATKAKMRASQQARRAAAPVSAETRAKVAAALKGKPKSEAARAAMSAAKKGKPGRKLSDAELANLVALTKSRVVSEATREKMRQAKLGKPGPWAGKTRGVQSPEHRAAIGAPFKGKFHTPEAKEQLRMARLGKPAHHKRGSRIDFLYEGYQMRSSYEVAFAKRLDRLGIDWMYEPTRFDLGTCTYTPDFYLPEQEAFWEVKGWLGPDSQAKIHAFRNLYPEVPLIVATATVLKSFGAL